MSPLSVYPDATVAEPDVPSRSRLIRLTPRAVGTPLAEGLPSYALRLAEAHSLPFGALVGEAIAPLMPSPAGRPADAGEIVALGAVSMVNGEQGRRWRNALAELTTVSLDPLTLLTWEQVLSKHHLVHEALRFCPECLDEFDAEPYEPLVWSLRRVTACPSHGRLLVDRCPACGSRQRTLRYRAVAGACRSCRAPLRTARPGAPASAWDRWASQSLAGVVAASGEPAPSGADLRGAIEGAVAFAGSRKRLTRLMGASSTGMVSLWVAGAMRPSVDLLLTLCAVGGWELPAFLRGRLVPATWAPNPHEVPGRPRRQQIDWHRVSRQAGRILRGGGEIPSVPSLATRLGVSESSLVVTMPDLVARAVVARREWVTVQATTRREDAAAVIDEAVARLVRDGVTPSARRVQMALPKPLSLREPALKEAWIAAVERSGLRARRRRSGPGSPPAGKGQTN